MAKYATYVSGAILLPSSIQVTESISGSVVPLAMFYLYLFFLVIVCISFSVSIFPSCSAAAVGDLDKSAAPSQFYVPAGNFHLRHSLAGEKYILPTQRNMLDQMAEIQLKG